MEKDSEYARLLPDIKRILARHLDLGKTRVFLFGSRASGTAQERSDFDIGIDGTKPISLHVLGAIKDELADLPTLYTIDVVDFKEVSPSFRAVADQHIIPITI